jgi:hypothetical protein
MNSTESIRENASNALREVREFVVAEAGVIHGITFDGRRLVLAAGERLTRLAPESGRVVDQFETFPSRGGLAYDGRCLWQPSGGRIQQLDRRTGFVLRSISPRLSDVTGLGCIGDDLLMLHLAGNALARVETLNATSVNVELKAPLHGLAWVARRLWSSQPGWLCCIDPATGAIVAQFALPPRTEVCDITGDAEGRLWCVDGRSRVVRAFITA